MKKWEQRMGNYTLDGEGFYISYNPCPGRGEARGKQMLVVVKQLLLITLLKLTLES